MVTGNGLVQPIALVCLSENVSELSSAEIECSLLETLESGNNKLESYAIVSHMVVFSESLAIMSISNRLPS